MHGRQKATVNTRRFEARLAHPRRCEYCGARLNYTNRSTFCAAHSTVEKRAEADRRRRDEIIRSPRRCRLCGFVRPMSYDVATGRGQKVCDECERSLATAG